MNAIKWTVTENNGGGLMLIVSDDGSGHKFTHSGYEYNPGTLFLDIKNLYDENNDVRGWEGDEPELEYDDHETSKLIAFGKNGEITLRVEDMGAAGLGEFMVQG